MLSLPQVLKAQGPKICVRVHVEGQESLVTNEGSEQAVDPCTENKRF